LKRWHCTLVWSFAGKLSDIRTSSGMFYGRGENAIVKGIEVCDFELYLSKV
jgi:hypothetical protein